MRHLILFALKCMEKTIPQVRHGGPIKRKAQKAIEGKIKLAMFGKAKCRLCGDEVRLALKHLRDKHVEIYRREVASKMKMSGVMKKYFVDY
jgi:hypothetical protein